MKNLLNKKLVLLLSFLLVSQLIIILSLLKKIPSPNSFIIPYGRVASVNVSSNIVSASGHLIEDNYKIGYPINIADIECRVEDEIQTCTFTQTDFTKEFVLGTLIENLRVLKWDSNQVIAVKEYKCRKNIWVIDFEKHKTTLESIYKAPEERPESCKASDTQTRNAHFGTWDEVLSKLNKESTQNK